MMTRRFLFASLTLAIAFAAVRGSAAQPAVPGLLVDAPATFQAPAFTAMAARRDTLQVRGTMVNLAALQADAFDVEVTPGRVLRAQLVRRGTNPDGSESWSGSVAGEPLSSATFVRAGAILQGSVRTLTGSYSIEPLDDSGAHVIREVDPSALGDELAPLVPDASGLLAGVAADSPPTSGDDGSTFDVLVVYTTAARTAAGGEAAIQARINLGITETNTAYANSGIIPRLRLVGAELIGYTEAGNLEIDLNAVTGTVDGQMDAVHARRNALGADLVKLVVGDTAGGACGVAWLMQFQSPGFASSAFSVTAYPCISPNYTFAHELGHNLGSTHAPEDGGSGGLYSYSYGYKHPGNQFRTVMAYNCTAVSCPRVLYFSNPLVNYNGLPTGTAAQHNNALSINNARNTVANWRQAVGGGNTAPTITAIANSSTPEDTPTAAIAFTIGDAQTAASSLVVTATSTNPSVVANTPAALTLGGAGASRTLVVTPQPNANGLSVITVSVSDGALSTPTTFQLTVTALNDPPVISAISAKTTAEDVSIAVPFTVSDVETAAGSLVVQATSSNTALVNAAGIGLGGSAGSRIVTLTPIANQSGTTTITVSVGDGTVTTQTTFTLTVTPTDDPPAFVGLAPLVSTTMGVPAAFAVTVSDTDSAGSTLTLAVSSANTVLLPPANIVVTPMSSTSGTRTFQVTLTPATAQTGTSVLTFTAGDGNGSTPAAVTFNVTSVAAAPDPPTAASATSASTNVTISWTPALTGTAPASFAVEMGTAPGTANLPTQSVAWPTTTLATVLPAGTYYTRVRAINGVGSSAPSPEATFTVTEPSPIPGPPGSFSARTTGRMVSFTWTASVTGAPATRYILEAGSAPGLSNLARLDTGTAATLFDVPNVPSGTYWVRVRGANAAGTGAPSQDVAIVMGASSGCVGLPGSPVMLTPVVSGYNVTLSWQAPSLGGAASSYVLQAGSATGLSDLANFNTGSSATSFAASAPSGLYYVRLAAANACGVGPVSNEVSFTLGGERPGTPQDPAWTLNAGVVSISWNAPATGAPATAYLLEAGSAPSLSNVAVVSTGSPVTWFATSAPPGVYYVRIRAINGAGPGAASSEIVVVVP